MAASSSVMASVSAAVEPRGSVKRSRTEAGSEVAGGVVAPLAESSATELSAKRQRTGIVDCCICMAVQGQSGEGILKEKCSNPHPGAYMCRACYDKAIAPKCWFNQKCPLCRKVWGTPPTPADVWNSAGNAAGSVGVEFDPALIAIIGIFCFVLVVFTLIHEAANPSGGGSCLSGVFTQVLLVLLALVGIFAVSGGAVVYFFGARLCLKMAGYYCAVNILFRLIRNYIWTPCRRRFRGTPA